MTVQSIPVASTAKEKAGPITSGERIAEIDILRGFALFGILLVNMYSFGHSFYEFVLRQSTYTGVFDQAAAFLIAFLAEGKFYSLFSFLFGFGLAIQMSRAGARGVRFVPIFIRRMLVLLVLGLLHFLLLWTGDILLPYAVLGLFLLLFRKLRPKSLLIWAIVMLVLITLINAALLGLTALASSAPEGAAMMEEVTRDTMASYQQAADQANRVYSSGTFLELFAQRASEMSFIYPITLFIAPNIFAMFLLGLAAGKKGIFENIPDRLPFFRKLQIWGLIIGVTGNLIFAIASRTSSQAIPTVTSLLATAGQTFGAPMLSAFYLASIVLLAQNPVWRRRLMVLAPVGRMALSNYLFQTLVSTTIFYSYGLGLYGQVGHGWGLLLTLIIFAVQIPISHWWMNRFQFGPFEWLWRTLTYGKPPKMRVQTA